MKIKSLWLHAWFLHNSGLQTGIYIFRKTYIRETTIHIPSCRMRLECTILHVGILINTVHYGKKFVHQMDLNITLKRHRTTNIFIKQQYERI